MEYPCSQIESRANATGAILPLLVLGLAVHLIHVPVGLKHPKKLEAEGFSSVSKANTILLRNLTKIILKSLPFASLQFVLVVS